tara:strand:+ start:1 stop:843 length:843 start_codon:yes stop_codon:yes gene_type:complete
MNKIGILGNPIKHSLSPKMHNYWLKDLNICGKYKAFKTPMKNFRSTINKLSKDNYLGVNLTIPLKENALKYLDKKDKIVDITGAANTIIFSKGKINGRNTDVYGFKKSLMNQVGNKEKKQASIIGSGGAARSVLYSLIEMKYKEIFIFNRSLKKSTKMKKDLTKNLNKALNSKIRCLRLKDVKNNLINTNLLINTTPMGMKGFPKLNINVENLNVKSIVFDLIYNPLETELLKKSKQRGIKTINGLDMLIYQAQRSFYYWFNKEPKVTNSLRKILEEEIK